MIELVENVSRIDGRDELLALLDSLSARVRAGDVTSLACAWTSPDHGVCSGWTVTRSGSCFLLSAAVHHLAFNLHVDSLKHTVLLPPPERGGDAPA